MSLQLRCELSVQTAEATSQQVRIHMTTRLPRLFGEDIVAMQPQGFFMSKLPDLFGFRCPTLCYPGFSARSLPAKFQAVSQFKVEHTAPDKLLRELEQKHVAGVDQADRIRNFLGENKSLEATNQLVDRPPHLVMQQISRRRPHGNSRVFQLDTFRKIVGPGQKCLRPAHVPTTKPEKEWTKVSNHKTALSQQHHQELEAAVDQIQSLKTMHCRHSAAVRKLVEKNQYFWAKMSQEMCSLVCQEAVRELNKSQFAQVVLLTGAGANLRLGNNKKISGVAQVVALLHVQSDSKKLTPLFKRLKADTQMSLKTPELAQSLHELLRTGVYVWQTVPLLTPPQSSVHNTRGGPQSHKHEWSKTQFGFLNLGDKKIDTSSLKHPRRPPNKFDPSAASLEISTVQDLLQTGNNSTTSTSHQCVSIFAVAVNTAFVRSKRLVDRISNYYALLKWLVVQVGSVNFQFSQLAETSIQAVDKYLNKQFRIHSTVCDSPTEQEGLEQGLVLEGRAESGDVFLNLGRGLTNLRLGSPRKFPEAAYRVVVTDRGVFVRAIMKKKKRASFKNGWFFAPSP